jgi:hypothetical protein
LTCPAQRPARAWIAEPMKTAGKGIRNPSPKVPHELVL